MLDWDQRDRGVSWEPIMDTPRDPPDPGDALATLLDFGGGRRLERLAGVLVDRPLPQARSPRRKPELWRNVAVTYTGGGSGGSRAGGWGAGDSLPRGWQGVGPLPDPWVVTVPLHRASLRLEVRPAASGQTGLFLEQAPQWGWIERTVARGARILSLFAHSGAATLAAAASGAEVVHVDASRPAMALARRNAAASGLAGAPIRWVCDDAGRFVARERRRGSRYDGVVLDPPSWGHGPRGEAFAIDRDLEPLLAEIRQIVPGPSMVLLTCHSPGWTPARLTTALAAAWGNHPSTESGTLSIHDAAGRALDLGAFARRALR